MFNIVPCVTLHLAPCDKSIENVHEIIEVHHTLHSTAHNGFIEAYLRSLRVAKKHLNLYSSKFSTYCVEQF